MTRRILACALLAIGAYYASVSSFVACAIADERVDESPLTAEDRDHWSFRPLVRPEIPKVATAWSRTPIDSFILAALARKDLSPLPEADRATLIRRLSFDLLGLPPKPADVAEFVADPAPDAYERLVDRLLASPRFGERMAQPWLDLARFAETDGYEFDKARPEAWKYRDWVIDALNRDVPYDLFVQLQLAGDELLPGDPSSAIATAFCLAGPDMPDVNSQDERRHNLLNEMTGTVSSVLLGLQIGCAQCHDHKYDPVSQADFYRLRAVFEPAVAVEKDKSVGVLREVAYKPAASRVWLRGDWRRPGPEVDPAYPRIANPWNESLPAGEAGAKSSGRRTALARWITRPDHPLATRVAANRLWQEHFGHGLSRTPNDFGVVGEAPYHADLLDFLATELVRRGWSQKELRRGIVTSAVYRQASRPNSANWSAEELAAAEASWKHSLDDDPNNELLSRFPRRRLEGEAIRDAMLCAAGSLSTRRGGPGVMPPLPDELVETLLKDQWKTSPDPEDHQRRSIYIFARRNLRYPVFEAFDRPDANATCARRNLSTTAPQSLLMLNSEFSLATAQRLAGTIVLERYADRALAKPVAQDSPALVISAFRRAFGREPVASEMATSLEFLDRQAKLLRAEGRPREKLSLPLPCPNDLNPHAGAALVDLCLALFNASEFVYID